MRCLKRNKKESVSINESVQSKTDLSSEIYNWAKDYILDNIDDWEGQSVYGSDLAIELTEGPNNNGSYEQDAWKFIGDHIHDAAKEYDYQKFNFGDVKNPFEDPDGFVVVWLIDAVGDILSKIDVIDDNWNNKVELTEDVIKEIKSAL